MSPPPPFIRNTKLVFNYMTSSGTHPLHTMRTHCKNKERKTVKQNTRKLKSIFYIKIL